MIQHQNPSPVTYNISPKNDAAVLAIAKDCIRQFVSDPHHSLNIVIPHDALLDAGMTEQELQTPFEIQDRVLNCRFLLYDKSIGKTGYNLFSHATYDSEERTLQLSISQTFLRDLQSMQIAKTQEGKNKIE